MADRQTATTPAAQPSPGGQGDARLLADVDERIATAKALGYEDDIGVGIGLLQCVRSALAARQPVYVQGCDELRARTEGERAAYMEGLEEGKKIAARQPVGEAPNFAACCAEGGGSISGCSCANPNHVFLDSQASLTAEERAHGETIDQRDRYHEVADELAGHIAAITGVDIGEHSSANCPWQNAIEAADEYKPARAVDLDELRRAVCVVNVVGQIDGHDVVRRNSVLDVIDNRRQRLIDSQGVVNG